MDLHEAGNSAELVWVWEEGFTCPVASFVIEANEFSSETAGDKRPGLSVPCHRVGSSVRASWRVAYHAAVALPNWPARSSKETFGSARRILSSTAIPTGSLSKIESQSDVRMLRPGAAIL